MDEKCPEHVYTFFGLCSKVFPNFTNVEEVKICGFYTRSNVVSTKEALIKDCTRFLTEIAGWTSTSPTANDVQSIILAMWRELIEFLSTRVCAYVRQTVTFFLFSQQYSVCWPISYDKSWIILVDKTHIVKMGRFWVDRFKYRLHVVSFVDQNDPTFAVWCWPTDTVLTCAKLTNRQYCRMLCTVRACSCLTTMKYFWRRCPVGEQEVNHVSKLGSAVSLNYTANAHWTDV